MKPSRKNLIKTTSIAAVLAAICILGSSVSYAAVFSGELFRTLVYADDVYNSEVRETNTVDFHSFNSLGGMYTFDVTGNTGYDDEGIYLGSGLEDSYIYIFRDDGLLDYYDTLAVNDDWADLGLGGESGSIYEYDSFLSLELEAGAYFLGVGAYCEGCDFNYATLMQEHISWPGYTGDTVEETFSLGTYTVNIQPAVVPLPAAAWLFCGALLGLAGLKRRHS